MTINNILKYHINKDIDNFCFQGGISISYKNGHNGKEETIIAYIKTEDFSDMSEHHIIAGRIIKYFIAIRNTNKTEVYAWIGSSYGLNAKITRRISKPLHSAYNPLFNGENPAHYKPENVMGKLHNYLFRWRLNDRKKRLALAKLLVCIFIDLRFKKVLNEETVDQIANDPRILRLHKLLRSRKNIKGKQILKRLKLQYWEIENYFLNHLVLTNNDQGFWDLIPDFPDKGNNLAAD